MSRKRPIGRKPNTSTLPEWPEHIIGGKYVRLLSKHLSALRTPGHGNSKLFLDDVVVAYLLAFFNPTLRSLRTLEDFSVTRQAQRHLSVRRFPRSTLSDFNRLADPTLLQPLIQQLLAQVPPLRGSEPPLPERLHHVLAVDGSFFTVAAEVAWAVQHRTNSGQRRASVRLDMHLNVHQWLPEIIDVAGADISEAEQALAHVKPGAIYVYDRGFFSFNLITAHATAGSEFVLRRRADGDRCPQFSGEQERPLSDDDRQAGVIADRLGRLVGSSHRQPPAALLREIIITAPNQPGQQIRLLTNILDLPAAVIGQIYRWRWQVELFFRWLKVYAHFDHLVSHSRAGVQLNFYVAVIGVLLMLLHLDAKPNKYAFSLLSFVASGAATLEEITPILAERQRQIAVAQARLARLKAEALR
jgi:hypothetical protein